MTSGDTLLVEQVPGADAGLATSAALESTRVQASLFATALLALGVETGVVLLVRTRRRVSTQRSSSRALELNASEAEGGAFR